MEKYNENMKEFNPSYSQHNIKLFMNHLLVGKPGSGKTNQVLNIIERCQGCFSKIQIYTPNNEGEPLYLMMEERLNKQKEGTVILEDIKNIPYLCDQPKGQGQQLIIIDDFITQGKKIMTIVEEYAIRGRQQLFTILFLSQSYYATPVKIRATIRYLCLLKITDKRNMDMIISTIASDIPSGILMKCIKNAVKFKMNVAVIDLQADDNNKIVRRNYGVDEYYIVEDENEEPIQNPKLFLTSGIKND